VKPTINHHFLVEFYKNNMLNMIFTQNIDGFEIDAGIKPENLV